MASEETIACETGHCNTDSAALAQVSLADRFDIGAKTALLSGTQALIRVALMQKARDAALGWRTAGYISGYRGSPLGAVDFTAQRAARELAAADIKFEAGLNEDLAATALWGTQQVHLRGEGRVEGVFGLWYGKGPGVDRSGDVFRHANLAGTAPKGGVLVVMGDDHTCESSTTAHQSDYALVDANMPILSPAGPQEVLDYGLVGWQLSRYAGVWVGLKCMKDTVEATAVCDTRLDRVKTVIPTDHHLPPGGVNIRLVDHPIEQEARLHEHKRPAVLAFARANRLDQRRIGKPGARLGIVCAGKSWLDVAHALDLLGIDAARAEQLGISVYKVAMVFPLEPQGLRDFAKGLDQIIVVEEKRTLIETQIKEFLYDLPDRPQVIGKQDEQGATLFQAKMDLNPVMIARALGARLRARHPADADLSARLSELEAAAASPNQPEAVTRLPYFCSGCPHNSSTKLPDGARAYAGIGCHFMVQWMDRNTIGYTHMGGEGANWIGEAPFSTRNHVFQNMGDGTYNHSGLMSIRAAVHSGVNITFKILYNDAVAMTGGQSHEGGLRPWQIAAEVLAAGVRKLVVVHDEKEPQDPADYPKGIAFYPRSELEAVQRQLQTEAGTTVLLYVQTCAAEKRRRRKRGKFPDPDQRVMINPLVCEGCGDCGLKSNCVSIVPLETPFGRKRAIDQSGCNKDFSCLNGFCPSFVTVHGGTPRKQVAAGVSIPPLPEPVVPTLRGTYNLIATGIGGTGVVTVGALIGMAAHLEGKGAGVMEMAGLAQKGGAVLIHCRVAPKPEDITAIRVGVGEADTIIGGDLVVTGGAKTLAEMRRGRTRVFCNSFEAMTGAFTRDPSFALPTDRLSLAIRAKVGEDAVRFADVSTLAARLLGDAIYGNVILLGMAWQAGAVPLSGAALRRAIELNGAAVKGNLQAFELGRWLAHDPKAVAGLVQANDHPPEASLAERVAFLTAYQNAAWAERYRRLVTMAEQAESRAGVSGFADAVMRAGFKLMSYKDEYEVARLHAEATEALAHQLFDGVRKLEFHLAPPILTRVDPITGEPRKRRFGGWILPVFKLLRWGKVLRGTPLDVFGYSAERRRERAAIAEFEADVAALAPLLSAQNLADAVALVSLPLGVRGYGHVKAKAEAKAAEARAALWAKLRAGTATRVVA